MFFWNWFPLEIDLMIIGHLDIPDIIGLTKLNKEFYFFFHKNLVKNYYHYIEFQKQSIKYLHLALLKDQERIIYWLIRHHIWDHNKTVNFYQCINSSHEKSKVSIILPVDITLAIAALSSRDRTLKYMIRNGIKPVSYGGFFYGIEKMILEEKQDYGMLLRLPKNCKKYNSKITPLQYQSFIKGIYHYKKYGNWRYIERIK